MKSEKEIKLKIKEVEKALQHCLNAIADSNRDRVANKILQLKAYLVALNWIVEKPPKPKKKAKKSRK
jgi:hypothetical protein